jgi:hypothetical protein
LVLRSQVAEGNNHIPSLAPLDHIRVLEKFKNNLENLKVVRG